MKGRIFLDICIFLSIFTLCTCKAAPEKSAAADNASVVSAACYLFFALFDCPRFYKARVFASASAADFGAERHCVFFNALRYVADVYANIQQFV